MDNLQTIDSYNKIILDNEWLIYKIINKYTSHLELEDLYQVASIGLIKAYKSFKDDYNTKFSSYAYKYVLGEVIKYVNQYRSIKVNKEMGNLYGKILKVRDLLCQKYMREPSNYELSVFMGIDEITLTEIMKANMEIDSLDKIISIDDKEMYLIMKRRECKYLLLLLMRKFNCLDKEIIKEQLKLKSDRTINNNIAKAEEKLLMNREFRDDFFCLEERIEKKI